MEGHRQKGVDRELSALFSLKERKDSSEILKETRISTTTQDPDPLYSKPQTETKMGRQAKYTIFKRVFLFEIFPLVALFVLPTFAHAGVFSAVVGLFSEEKAAVERVQFVQNIQTTPLLKAAVHSDPNPSKGGGDIITDRGALVPEVGPAGNNPTIEQVSDNGGRITIHEVKPGRTLSEIAEMFDVSIKTIKWANDIQDEDLIQPGDELVILPITGVRHVVKEDDTFASIAKKYNGDVDDILAYNGLSDGHVLAPGETVVVPGGEIASPSPAPSRSTASAAVSAPAPSSNETASGGFIRPAAGQKTQGLHGYNGIDFAGNTGSPIYAAAAGEVIVSRANGLWNGGYGNYIVVKHANGTQTLYAHNSANYVTVGQRVSQGETIGAIGSTGRSTGAHLHFEVRGARNPF